MTFRSKDPKNPVDGDEENPVIKDPTVKQPNVDDEEDTNVLPTDQNNKNNKENQKIIEKTPNANKTGVTLPKTATNYFNYLIAGLMLLVIGGSILVYRKKDLRIE